MAKQKTILINEINFEFNNNYLELFEQNSLFCEYNENNGIFLFNTDKLQELLNDFKLFKKNDDKLINRIETDLKKVKLQPMFFDFIFYKIKFI